MAKALAGLLLVVAAVGLVPRPAEAKIIDWAVVGSPGEDVGGERDAGAVHLVPELDGKLDPSQATTVTRATLGGTPTAGDAFGRAVLLTDVTGDRIDDLVIGAPGADDGAGRVYVLEGFGATFDFRDPMVLQQGRAGVKGITEDGDRFGASLALGWYDVRFSTRFLAVGAPGEDIGAALDAGTVTTMAVGFAAPDHGRSRVWYQGAEVDGVLVPGAAETGDRFGTSLAGFGFGVAIGAPGEDLGPDTDVGAVTEVRPYGVHQGATEWYESSDGLPGEPEAGDRFGAALGSAAGRTLLIGAPGQTVEGAADAGVVYEIGLGGEAPTAWAQGVSLTGTPEAGDRFGAAIGATDELAVIGAPGEDVWGATDAGIVHTLEVVQAGEPLSGEGSRQLHQDSPGVPGTGEDGDGFGTELASFGGMLLVGMPREDVHDVADAGAVIALSFWEGASVRASRSVQLTQDDLRRSTAEAGDRFGFALG